MSAPRDRADREVHARGGDGREVVRYDRAGKWYIERHDGTRTATPLAGAVTEAVAIAAEPHGTVFYGRHGGNQFDRHVKNATAETTP